MSMLTAPTSSSILCLRAPFSWCPAHPSIHWSTLSSIYPTSLPQEACTCCSSKWLVITCSQSLQAFSSATCMWAPNGVKTEQSPLWCNICSVLRVLFSSWPFLPLWLIRTAARQEEAHKWKWQHEKMFDPGGLCLIFIYISHKKWLVLQAK